MNRLKFLLLAILCLGISGSLTSAAAQTSSGKVLVSGKQTLRQVDVDTIIKFYEWAFETEFTAPDSGPGHEPWTDRAKAAVKAAFNHQLLLLTCGTYDNIIRWIPPLVVNEAQIKEALAVFEQALGEGAAG